MRFLTTPFVVQRQKIAAAAAAAAEAASKPRKSVKQGKRKSLFAMLMEKKVPGKSLLEGRGSIAWERPPASSTMVRGPSFDFQGGLANGHGNPEGEEMLTEEDEEATPVVPTRSGH